MFLKKIHRRISGVWFPCWEVVSKTELHLRYVSHEQACRKLSSLPVPLVSYFFIDSVSERWEELAQWKFTRPLRLWLHWPLPPAALLSGAVETVVGQAGAGGHSRTRLGACAKASALHGFGGSVPAGGVTLMALKSFLSDGWVDGIQQTWGSWVLSCDC